MFRAKHPTPRLAKEVVGGDAEVTDEVFKLTKEESDGPE